VEQRDGLAPLLQVRAALVLCAAASAVHSRHPALHDRADHALAFLEAQKEFMARHDDELLAACTSPDPNPAAAGLARTPLLQQYAMLKAHRQMLNKDISGCLQTLHDVYRNGIQSPNPTAALLPILYFNNLGVVHLALNKPNVTSLYFAKAVESFERYKAQFAATALDNLSALPGTGLGFSRVGTSMCHVLYNNAMCLLQREKYELAFRSLVVATPLLHTLPTLWLRLAQCCIKVHELTARKGRDERSGGGGAGGQGIVITSRPTPAGTVYQLPTRGSATTVATTANPDATGASMSLTFADKCLRNAHYLLLRQGRLLLAASGSTGGAAHADNPPAPKATLEGGEAGPEAEDAAAGSDTPSTQEILDALAMDPTYSPLLQAAYVDMAYVALALNNPSVALHEAKQLLNTPNCSKENKIVTLSYIAEALCWLNKPAEALQILHSVNLQELLADKMSDLNRRNAEALFVNLSIVHIMQNKYQRAQECIKQFISRSSSHHSILLQIYLDLVQGNKERVNELLSKHAQHFTIPL
jgi:hypothetical protein